MTQEPAEGSILLEPGTLWPTVLEATEGARRSGALQPIATGCHVVEHQGVAFVVREVSGLEGEAKAQGEKARRGENPFLPYDEELFVADISATHLCLLNRFNVVDHHLLIVTREFEKQESLLTLRDFEALWACLQEIDGLGFYNAGTVAGASQPHKHLQLVPLPLGPGVERIPIEPLLTSADLGGAVGTAPGLPFLHAWARLGATSAGRPIALAQASFDLYRELLRAVGLEQDPGPYNLLLTREWILLVPRSQETFQSIEVNALGFAGTLLVRSQEQLALLRQVGPMSLLRQVGVAGRGEAGAKGRRESDRI